ncbi:hypothetical protein [Leptolyngbya sp. KIOST-1]|jgi:hypothetical protein|nr:hypothetical protein [Leptolyngbya sp. KIOST-1]
MGLKQAHKAYGKTWITILGYPPWGHFLGVERYIHDGEHFIILSSPGKAI